MLLSLQAHLFPLLQFSKTRIDVARALKALIRSAGSLQMILELVSYVQQHVETVEREAAILTLDCDSADQKDYSNDNDSIEESHSITDNDRSTHIRSSDNKERVGRGSRPWGYSRPYHKRNIKCRCA